MLIGHLDLNKRRLSQSHCFDGNSTWLRVRLFEMRTIPRSTEVSESLPAPSFPAPLIHATKDGVFRLQLALFDSLCGSASTMPQLCLVFLRGSQPMKCPRSPVDRHCRASRPNLAADEIVKLCVHWLGVIGQNTGMRDIISHAHSLRGLYHLFVDEVIYSLPLFLTS